MNAFQTIQQALESSFLALITGSHASASEGAGNPTRRTAALRLEDVCRLYPLIEPEIRQLFDKQLAVWCQQHADPIRAAWSQIPVAFQQVIQASTGWDTAGLETGGER